MDGQEPLGVQNGVLVLSDNKLVQKLGHPYAFVQHIAFYQYMKHFPLGIEINLLSGDLLDDGERPIAV